jgi:hypothetical protein
MPQEHNGESTLLLSYRLYFKIDWTLHRNCFFSRWVWWKKKENKLFLQSDGKRCNVICDVLNHKIIYVKIHPSRTYKLCSGKTACCELRHVQRQTTDILQKNLINGLSPCVIREIYYSRMADKNQKRAHSNLPLNTRMKRNLKAHTSYWRQSRATKLADKKLEF